ncbi:hypothetical protein AAG570_004854, partial [Ranatra chinensis]
QQNSNFRKSNFHKLYQLLFPLSTESNYINKLKSEEASLVFQVRGEILNPKNKLLKPECDDRCTLYNMGAREDTFHFVAECPVLSEFRWASFGKDTLTTEKAYNYANGGDWDKLILFVRSPRKYRRFLEENHK